MACLWRLCRGASASASVDDYQGAAANYRSGRGGEAEGDGEGRHGGGGGRGWGGRVREGEPWDARGHIWTSYCGVKWGLFSRESRGGGSSRLGRHGTIFSAKVHGELKGVLVGNRRKHQAVDNVFGDETSNQFVPLLKHTAGAGVCRNDLDSARVDITLMFGTRRLVD